ncbi:hypothetical protein C9374_013504 [Naegleria lovaniensis]|uniref:Zn(2)-C6 fungal-type domain-containing protein n=1 Tax=Naegleria lovaniensis TaxID=51637 RepID=A0AA88KQQ9_NAELO|nr:uncharacterized protein C9374_013504 [Naegleria lovaniensis]KAG2392019.1 hypothetical protein C9374_013504 [Naegleria lovaniensis]
MFEQSPLPNPDNHISSPPTMASKPCSSCRNLHRKCDKLRPSCSHCLKRGYECVYGPSSAEKRRLANKQTQQPATTNNAKNAKNKTCTNEIVFSFSEYQHDDSSRNYHNGNRLNYHHYHPYSQSCGFSTSSNSTHSNCISTHPQPNYRPHPSLYANPNETQIQHAINYRLSTTQTMDIYFNFTCLGIPLIDRKKLEFIIESQLTSGYNGIANYTHSQQPPLYSQNDLEKDLAVFYLLQAVSLQQAGSFHDTFNSMNAERNTLLPQHLFQHGKQLISKYCDDFDSMNLIIATKFMADYLLGEGEKSKARALMVHVRAKLQPHLSNCTSNTTQYQQEFSSMNFSPFSNSAHANRNDFFELSIPQIFSSQNFVTAMLIETQLRYADIFFYEEERPTTFIFDEFEALSNHKIKFSRQKLFGEAASSCTDISEELSQKLIQAIHVGMRCFDSIFTSTFAKRNTTLFLLAHLYGRQIYLEILVNSKVRNLTEIMKVCSDIMILATTHTCFQFLPVVATKAVLMAISLRFSYVVEYHASTCGMKLNEEKNCSTQINLNDDLKILKSLCHRFKLIRDEKRDLVKALESLVYLQQEQTQNARKESTLLGSVLPLIDVNREAPLLVPSLSKHDNSVISKDERPLWSLSQEKFAPHSFKQAVREVLENPELMEIFIDGLAEQNMINEGCSTTLTEDSNSLKTQQLLLEKRLEIANKIIALSKNNHDLTGILEGESFKKFICAEFENACANNN